MSAAGGAEPVAGRAPAAVRPASAPGAVLSPSALETPVSRTAPLVPQRSLSRAVKYGFVASVLGLALTFGGQLVASALGYAQHSNYVAPAVGAGGMTPAALFFAVAVFAPITEEILFRAGLMQGLEKVAAKVMPPRWAALAAGVASSAVFVALHETSDPVLMALRMVDALLMSWVYRREGLAASMTMHAGHNGALFALLAASMLPGWVAGAVAVAAVAGLPPLLKTIRELWLQREDRAAGRIVRHELGETPATVLAALLLVGSLFLAPQLAVTAFPFALGLYFYGRGRPDALGRKKR